MSYEEINPFDLPSVGIDQRFKLPAAPVVYFICDDKEIFYIGKTENAKKRWAAHHRYTQMLSISNVKIAYLLVDCSQISSLEFRFIKAFNPKWNKTKVESMLKLEGRYAEIIRDIAAIRDESCNDALYHIIDTYRQAQRGNIAPVVNPTATPVTPVVNVKEDMVKPVIEADEISLDEFE